MKTLATTLVVLSLTLLPGCGTSHSKQLTTKKAQKVIDQIKKGGGTAVVNGVRSEQMRGATVADLSLTNFGYRDNNGASKTYSGTAEAIFQGYTDGRWTLKEMRFPDRNAKFGGNVSFEYNITVE